MKNQIKHLLIALTLLSALNSQLSIAFAQGTAFTYQGRLQNNGSPASGTYNLTFAVFTDSNGVNQVGSTLTNTATGITNGLFTVVQSEEHTSELQSLRHLVCRLLLE